MNGLIRAALILIFIAGCSRPPPELDAAGRALLDPIRERALRPAETLARLALAPDAIVADVGAGPGFLTLPLARAVPRGRVIATDVREDYLAVLAARARAAGRKNVETRRVPPDDPGLGAHAVDVALLCQLDHGLANRADYFSRLKATLRPGGRIVLVNYMRYRAPDLAAADASGLRVADAWDPSPAFFVLVLAPREEHALDR